MIVIDKEFYRKFQESNLPFKYSINEIEQILKQKYRAVEIDINTFKEKDPYYNIENVVKCYKIEDKSILDKLYNEEEKKIQKDYSEKYNEKDLSKSKTNLSTLMWKDINEGKLINILLEKKGQNALVDFTIQGLCDKLVAEMTILRGIDPKDCITGNRIFDNYINCLTKLGYI